MLTFGDIAALVQIGKERRPPVSIITRSGGGVGRLHGGRWGRGWRATGGRGRGRRGGIGRGGPAEVATLWIGDIEKYTLGHSFFLIQ